MPADEAGARFAPVVPGGAVVGVLADALVERKHLPLPVEKVERVACRHLGLGVHRRTVLV